MPDKKIDIALIKQEINTELANPEVFNSLLQITFKGLEPQLAKRAILEGMMTGFTFKDFLEKNIYAIPFNNKDGKSYSLVTSIDHTRKVGMRSGIIGVSAPKYVDDIDGNILTCEITVKRKVDDSIGEYTALVYFKEYTTGYQQWKAKPRTMIAKVAEMHALRKACPEELSHSYIEEEFEKETKFIEDIAEKKDEEKIVYALRMTKSKTMEELSAIWETIPAELKAEKEILEVKNNQKIKLTPLEGEIVK